METSPLSRRIALVTGGSGGIGSATCRQLAEAGATVIATYNEAEDQARDLVASFPGGRHMALRVVVDDDQSLRDATDTIARNYGRLDVLVNTVGVTKYVPASDLDGLEDGLIDEIFRVNWRGSFATIRALKPLLDRGSQSVVVNISSIAAVTGDGSNVAYCASKAALDSMTRTLARSLAPGLRVVSIAPGLVEGAYAKTLEAGWSQRQIDQTPLRRIATPDDVARAVIAAVALLTFSTGCVIPVDGGRILGT